MEIQNVMTHNRTSQHRNQNVKYDINVMTHNRTSQHRNQKRNDDT